MIALLRNVLDLAMDCFYVGHEIYHLIAAQETGDMPEEIRGLMRTYICLQSCYLSISICWMNMAH